MGWENKVDSKIEETVVAVIANDFDTNGSCEGHLDHGLPYPWIDISTPVPEDWQNSEEKKEFWKKENLKQQEKMKEIMDEFYEEKPDSERKLIFKPLGVFGSFRIQSQGAEKVERLSKEERRVKLEEYRKEMEEFSNFLKKKFFESD